MKHVISKTHCIALFLLILLTGCTTLATEAAKKAFEDRTTEDQVTDSKITTNLLNQLSNKDKGLLLDVNIDSWEGRVLLTGTLDDAQTRSEVVSMAKNDDRVKTVYNEIQLVTTAEKEQRRQEKEEGAKEEQGGMGQSVDDFWINTKIQGQLLAAKTVTSVNYRWRSVMNQVYIIGRSANSLEHDVVIETITQTKGVKSVHDFIEIKSLT